MLLGVMNAVLEATRYLPQVFASWHSEGSGALSYLRLLLSIGGAGGATVQKALMHEDVSTWFPPLVGHSLEIVIVAINLYHDVSGARRRDGSEFGSERGVDDGESGREGESRARGDASYGTQPRGEDRGGESRHGAGRAGESLSKKMKKRKERERGARKP